MSALRPLVIACTTGALLLTGTLNCVPDARTRRHRSNFGGTAGKITTPEQDRCALHGTSSIRPQCDEAKYLAQTYVRKLAPGDQVCLEETFGEDPGGACKARAAVVSVGTNLVLLEIRSPKPDSRWYAHQMSEIWFEEGALVDLYLAERGY